MNRENVEKLRDYLRDEVADEKFDMQDFLLRGHGLPSPYDKTVGKALEDCGTAACIGGWAQFLFKPARKWSYEISRDVLGLTDREACSLFTPHLGVPYRTLTRARAVATLTRLLETGTVDWGTE